MNKYLKILNSFNLRSYQLRFTKSTLGDISALNFNIHSRPRRQEWDGELVETGMFYFSNRKMIINGAFQNNK